MAQMPVPHPASRTRFGGLSAEMGAVKRRLSWQRMQRLCWRSGGSVSMFEVLPVWSGAYLDGWFPSGEVLAEESRAKDQDCAHRVVWHEIGC